MTVTRKILAGFSALILTATCCGLAVNLAVHALEEEFSEIRNDSIPMQQALNQVTQSLAASFSQAHLLAHHREPEAYALARAKLRSVQEQIENYASIRSADGSIDEEEDRVESETIQKLRQLQTSLEGAIAEIEIGADNEGDSHVGKDAFEVKLDALRQTANTVVEQAAAQEAKEIAVLATQVDHALQAVELAAVVNIVGVVLVSVILAAIAMTQISWPARRLREAVAQFGSGNLQVRAVRESTDELGELATAFNRMADQVQTSARELRQKEAQASELAQVKSRFAAMVSHEFRTPLAVIQAAAGALRRFGDKMSVEQRIDRLHRIEHQVEHMTEMLEYVLTLGRLEMGQQKFNPSPFDARQLCSEILSDLAQTSEAARSLVLDAQADSYPVMADASLLRQALRNVLTNALKYSPSDREVRCLLRTEAKETCIQVLDQGIGIATADLERLFQPFERGSNVGNIPGTGLGLLVTKHAIEAHGGTFEIESIEGKGTTATIRLPSAGLQPS